MSPDAEATLRLLGEANGTRYTSRQVGLLLLHEGQVSVDRCRDLAMPDADRMPHASEKQLVRYGAQNIAVNVLVQLRERGMVKKSNGRPAEYTLTEKGRYAARQHD